MAAAAATMAACFLLGFLAGYRVDVPGGAAASSEWGMEARCATPEPPPMRLDDALARSANRVARTYSRPGLRTVVVRFFYHIY